MGIEKQLRRNKFLLPHAKNDWYEGVNSKNNRCFLSKNFLFLKTNRIQFLNYGLKNMETLEIKIPETLNMTKMQVAMFLASNFYKEGKLSLGQAAEMAGLSKRAFMELLGDYNVSVFNYSAAELENDIANA